MKIMINGITVDATPEQEAAMIFLTESATYNLSAYTQALVIKINTTANEKSYSDGVSCASYKDSTNPQWASEATAFIAWRDNCYIYAYDYQEKVSNGIIVNPTIESFLEGLPAIQWP